LARVGVSFIDVDQACNNAEKEISNFDFDTTHQAALTAWQKALSPVSITPGQGVNQDFQITFWSGIYRSLISPQDYTGENPLWASAEPYYDSFYCIWDSFRSIHSLITLIDPFSQIQMIRSLIDIYRHEGWLPDCRMSLCKGFTQGGSNADVLLTDMYVKLGESSMAHGVNWTTAYEALVQDAEVEPRNWNLEGRGGLRSWKSLGYIPINDVDPDGTGIMTRSVSRTVEYAYNDYCVAVLADALDHQADYSKYTNRSANWK
jgi:putative alpha-1,2-mannosidase